MNELTNSPYKNLIGKHFDYTGEFDFLDLVARILDRCENLSDPESVCNTIGDTLIYTSDEWLVLKHYCSPSNANWSEAIYAFEDDLIALAEKASKADKENA